MDLPLISQLRSRLESILLVLDSPAPVESLARALGAERDVVSDCLRSIQRELDSRGSGIDLRETQEGWRFYTRTDNAGAVEEFLLDGAQTKLSRAALETLAVVAYRQPVTRQQVAAVRGVNVDGVMRTLNLRGLVRELPQEILRAPHTGTRQRNCFSSYWGSILWSACLTWHRCCLTSRRSTKSTSVG